ncbi:MAG: helix-turn-helix domain-containing protein [Candidatus Binatia bacterium]
MMRRKATKTEGAHSSKEQTSNMPAISLDLDPYLSLRALATYSGLSVRTLRKALADSAHPLPHYRPGGSKVLVRRSDFDRWMLRFRREGQDLDRMVSQALGGLKP